MSKSKLPVVIIICPSLGKPCGIARYSGYVSDSLNNYGFRVKLTNSSDDVVSAWEDNYNDSIIIIQHEYGLFDSFSDLGVGETTSELLANLSFIRDQANFIGSIAIIMHSLVLEDHVLNTINKQIFASGFPIFHLNSEGARSAKINFLEHGVYKVTEMRNSPTFSSIEEFRIGAFGLLSPNKDLSSLFQICKDTGAQLHANFACFDEALKRRYSNEMREWQIGGRLEFEFLSEEELAIFLSDSNVIYLPQHEIPHYATSGSARFALGIGRPLLVPAHRPFHDLAPCVSFGDLGIAISTISKFVRRPDMYHEAVERVYEFVNRYPILTVYRDLIDRLAHHHYVIGGYIRNINNLQIVNVNAFYAKDSDPGAQFDSLLKRRYRLAEYAVKSSGQIPAGGQLWQGLVGGASTATVKITDTNAENAKYSEYKKSNIPFVKESLQKIEELEVEWINILHTQDKNSLLNALNFLMENYSTTKNSDAGISFLLRLFGLDYGRFPLMEFIDFPLVVQAAFMFREKLIDGFEIGNFFHSLYEARNDANGE